MAYTSKGSITPDWFEKQSRRHRDIVFETIWDIRVEEKKQKDEANKAYENDILKSQRKFKV